MTILKYRRKMLKEALKEVNRYDLIDYIDSLTDLQIVELWSNIVTMLQKEKMENE